jgi:hypothetical protein
MPAPLPQRLTPDQAAPSQDSASATARTAAKSRQGGRLFERIEDAVDKAFGIPGNDDP